MYGAYVNWVSTALVPRLARGALAITGQAHCYPGRNHDWLFMSWDYHRFVRDFSLWESGGAKFASSGGIRVIDFGRFIAGPYCAMLLADMGADVIRVDRRQGSEDRYIAAITESGEGGGFLSLNRNKRNLTLDTSKPESAEIIRRLVKGADVVVANLPMNVLKSMRLDYDSLKATKPDIILARISTFGPDGPYANRVGFDTVAQAMSGAMSLTGFPGAPVRELFRLKIMAPRCTRRSA